MSVAPTRPRRSRASGRTPATTWCRGWRRRRTARVRRPGRRRSSRRARRGAWRTRRRAARCGSDRCRCRRSADPSRCSSAPATVAYATSLDVSPSALTAPPVARQRAARIATRTASLAEPWITPPPCSLVERNASGQAEQLDHPVEHQRLELGAGRRRDPTHALHAEPGGQQLGEDRRERVVRREVGEEVRVLPLREAGHDDSIEVGHHGGERLGFGRRVVGQRGSHVAGRDRRLHRPLVDLGDVVGDPVDQRVAAGAELLGCHGSIVSVCVPSPRRRSVARSSSARFLRTPMMIRQKMNAMPAITRTKTRFSSAPPRSSLPQPGLSTSPTQSLRSRSSGRNSFAVTGGRATARAAIAVATLGAVADQRDERERGDQETDGCEPTGCPTIHVLESIASTSQPLVGPRHRSGRRLRCAVRPAHRAAGPRAAGALRDRAAPHHRRRGEGACTVGDHPVGRAEERARRRCADARPRHLRTRHPGARHLLRRPADRPAARRHGRSRHARRVRPHDA